MSGGHQTSSQVAHEAEDTRAHLASTLEQLRENLQPQNVLEEVVTNARIGAASVADNLAGVARQYPIPSVLLAAGSALAMRLFSRRGDGALDPGPVARPSALRPPMLRNPSSFEPAPGRGGSAAPDFGDTASGTLDAIRSRAAGAYDAAASRAGDAARAVSRRMPSDRAEVKSRLATLLEEQPLVLGAIGLAIGAAIGAALPMTEAEDSLMGASAHRLRDSASEAARQEVDGIRSAAGAAMDNVLHAAEDNFKTVIERAGDSLHGAQDV